MRMKRSTALLVGALSPALLCSTTLLNSPKAFSADIYTPAWSTGADDNANIPIIAASDPDHVSETITSKNVTMGFDNLGGAYINSVKIGSGGNIVDTLYGRGWQSALRDHLHSGRYNPTQAGFEARAGATVNAHVTGNELTVPKYRLPLFSDPLYDFTQNEDLYPDLYANDNGNSDHDGLPEVGSTQDDEVRSEFTYGGHVGDVSGGTYAGIPGFRQTFYYAYSESPKAILQFGPTGVRDNGSPVIDENSRLQDISKSLPGDQTATDTDLSTSLIETLGIRINKDQADVYDYRYPMSWQNGGWNVGKDLLSNPYPNLYFMNSDMSYKNTNGQDPMPAVQQNTDLQMAIISDGTDPSTGHAIGLYFPTKGMNARQVVGIQRSTGSILYSEDRRMKSLVNFSYNNTVHQIVVRPVVYFSGLLAPTHTQPGTFEAMYNEGIVLFGTPEAILATVLKMEGTATPAQLTYLVGQFVKGPGSQGIVHSLTEDLQDQDVDAFIEEVSAQSGKAISESDAQLLTQLAQALRAADR